MSARRRRALVTGTTGFIGSHVVSRLLAEGWEVAILSRSRNHISRAATGVRVYPYDGHIGTVLAAFAQFGPEVVFHLASLFIAEHAPAQVEPLVESNILFGTQLLEAMSVHGVQYLVNAGSYWQHYQDSDYDPVCLYAASKQAFEAMLAYFVNARSLSAITLRLFDTYGPNDPRPKLLHLLYKTAVEGGRLRMSPGEQQLSFVYIDDVVDAFLIAANHLVAGTVSGSEVYTAGADQPVRLRELVPLFARVIGLPIDVEWGAQPYRPRQIMVPYTHGVRLPGWRPKITLENGLCRLLSNSSHIQHVLSVEASQYKVLPAVALSSASSASCLP